MGSLRTPIGPLPASVYWRRRSVALIVLALLLALVLWALTLGDDTRQDRGDGGGGGEGDGRQPTAPITPGPSGSAPSDDTRPGGRDEAGGGDDGGSGSGGANDTSGGGDSSGDDGNGGAGGGGSQDGSAGEDGSGGGSGGGLSGGDDGGGALSGASGGLGGGESGGGGDGVNGGAAAAGSLRDCEAGEVSVTLRSVDNEFAPGEKPEFDLAVVNDSSSACRVDLGRAAAVLTVTRADDDKRVWSSKDCPSATSAAYVEVPGDGASKHRLEWDRKASAPKCGKPAKGLVEEGETYLAEIEIAGAGSARASFLLTED